MFKVLTFYVKCSDIMNIMIWRYTNIIGLIWIGISCVQQVKINNKNCKKNNKVAMNQSLFEHMMKLNGCILMHFNTILPKE